MKLQLLSSGKERISFKTDFLLLRQSRKKILYIKKLKKYIIYTPVYTSLERIKCRGGIQHGNSLALQFGICTVSVSILYLSMVQYLYSTVAQQYGSSAFTLYLSTVQYLCLYSVYVYSMVPPQYSTSASTLYLSTVQYLLHIHELNNFS